MRMQPKKYYILDSVSHVRKYKLASCAPTASQRVGSKEGLILDKDLMILSWNLCRLLLEPKRNMIGFGYKGNKIYLA
jgi:hypothetical protein